MSEPITKEQVVAALQTIKVVADTIRELGEVPSGVLYSQVMQHVSLQSYQSIIERLKGAKLIREKHNKLIWVGPVQCPVCKQVKDTYDSSTWGCRRIVLHDDREGGACPGDWKGVK